MLDLKVHFTRANCEVTESKKINR